MLDQFALDLVLDLSQDLLSDESIARADSCATADHPMIDHIWRERLPLADLLVRIGADGAAKFALIRTLESLRRSAIASANAARADAAAAEERARLAQNTPPPAPPEPPPSKPPATLPSTASPLPLIGLSGLLSLGAAGALRLLRR